MAAPLKKGGSTKHVEGAGTCVLNDGGGGAAGSEQLKIWVPDKTELWQLAHVVRPGDTEGELVVQPLGADGRPAAEGEIEIENDVTQPWDDTHGEDLADIALMNDLNEAPMLHLLRRRFFSDKIYT